MRRRYNLWIHDEACPLQTANLLRTVREGYGDARRVHDFRKLARLRHADRLQQPPRGVGGKREHDRIGLVRRAAGDGDTPAAPVAREARDAVREPQGAGEPARKRDDWLTHSSREA